MNQRRVYWLLVVTAAIELGVGLALLGLPALTTELLLGATLESAAATTMARIGGAAISALGAVCALARSESAAARGLVATMLFYNVAVAAILATAYWQAGLYGVGLWPGVIFHLVMAGWCVMKLLGK